MNQVKLFLAIMLAVAMMQLNASTQRSQQQDNLQDALLDWKNDLNRDCFQDDLFTSQMFAAILPSCCLNVEYKPDNLESYHKKINEFEVGLSHCGKNLKELKIIAAEIKKLSPPVAYKENILQQRVVERCNEILACRDDLNFAMQKFLSEKA